MGGGLSWTVFGHYHRRHFSFYAIFFSFRESNLQHLSVLELTDTTSLTPHKLGKGMSEAYLFILTLKDCILHQVTSASINLIVSILKLHFKRPDFDGDHMASENQPLV